MFKEMSFSRKEMKAPRQLSKDKLKGRKRKKAEFSAPHRGPGLRLIHKAAVPYMKGVLLGDRCGAAGCSRTLTPRWAGLHKNSPSP